MKRYPRNKHYPAGLLLFFAASLVAFASQISFAQNGLSMHGKQIFDTKCTPCHTIGGGRKVGPDLQGVTKLRPKAWLVAFISDPEKMFSQDDATAEQLLEEYKIKMPNMGLSSDEVNSVISYLATQAGAAPETHAAPPAQTPVAAERPSVADAGRGEQLFIGKVAFVNNGPPCMGCHSVSGLKYFGGGTLGPDLTTAYTALGPGLVSMLTNVPFPTMKPIFDRHPLTAAEAGDLAAFLQTAASKQPDNLSGRFTIASLTVFVILMLVISVLGRRRLRSVRKSMVERAEQEGAER